MFNLFGGVFQQLQQWDAEQRQQEQLKRQQQQIVVDGLLRACSGGDEIACNRIIEMKGMTPYANYLAFAMRGDIERQRGDIEAARASYQHALRWADRMQDGSNATRSVRSKIAALTPGSNPNKTRSQLLARRQPGNKYNPSSQRDRNQAPQGDLVCDASAPVKWRIACLQAAQGPEGAELYKKLSELLNSHGVTLRQVLECDALIQKSQQSGTECFQKKGIESSIMGMVQIYALQYDLLVDVRLKQN